MRFSLFPSDLCSLPPTSPGLHSEVYRAPMVYFNFGAQGRIRYRPITHRGFLFGNFQWKLWSIIKDDMPITGVPLLAPPSLSSGSRLWTAGAGCPDIVEAVETIHVDRCSFS